MGGSTMKTAKVWRYFDQLPSELQAAACKLCFKRIKATNSSTTGMIRHLRSCHVKEYQILQEARQSVIALKLDTKSRNNVMKQINESEMDAVKSSKPHTIVNIIAGSIKGRVKSINKHPVRNAPSNQPQSKKAKLNHCDAIDLSTHHLRGDYGNSSIFIDRVDENYWPDDHPEALRITYQVGLMLLLDNEAPNAVDRAGFNSLLRMLEPKYRMPSAEKFQQIIIPQIYNQLNLDSLGMQWSFYKNNFLNREWTINDLMMGINAGCFFDIFGQLTAFPPYQLITPNQGELDNVIINSIKSAQNISQSFSHNIQLIDEDSESNADSESALSVRIENFLERIGKYVFPQVEVVNLLTRCYSIYRYFDEHPEEAVEISSETPTLSSCVDLAKCVEFVHKNWNAVEMLHLKRPIPSYKAFTNEDIQLLSDLDAYICSMCR